MIEDFITDEPVTAEYFATVDNGKIVTYAWAHPPHTLLPCQFALTAQEFYLLQALDGKIEKAAKTIRDIKAKIKSNGS